VGRCIPTTVRGRFFAVSHVLGNLGGLAGSVLTAWVLAAVAPPASFGICFVAATVVMMLSYWALTLIREPEGEPPAPGRPILEYLAQIPSLLRRDRNLSWFLTSRVCAVMGGMAAGFFTVYALRVHGAPAWQVGVFTTLMLAGHTGGSLALGWLADHFGHRLVLILGAGAMLAANLLALTASTLETFQIVFVAAGFHQASVNVSYMNILLDFAPVTEERPTYVGLGNTTMAPVALLSPLAAGLLADAAGFGIVFALAAGCGAITLGVLLARVREPRRARIQAE
jgi:Na+/melibiose symporter-like transporter